MRDIKGYENKYAITSCGKVWSYRRKKFLKPHILRNGYSIVELSTKPYLVHRLVAETYLDNPNNYSVVNHIDENKQNNSLNNLEWCTHRYNSQYSRGLKVICLETGIVYNSINECAEHMNICGSHISNVCKHKYGHKSCNGYHFEFMEDFYD